MCAPALARAEKAQKRGMLGVDRVGDRRSWAILEQNFFCGFMEKTAVVRAVGKVKIPLRLRDFQVEWESPAFGLFHGTAFSTALLSIAGTAP